jgi:hypothetical protein
LRGGCLAVYPANEDHNCLSEARHWAIHYADGYSITRPDGLPAWDIEPEKVANARLIAASPTMLEALEAVVDCVARGNDQAYIRLEALALVEQAILAARGEAQP